MASEAVERLGKGRSNDPFMYRLASMDQSMSQGKKSCSLVPSIHGEQENNTSKNDETPHEQKAMSCSKKNGLSDDSLESQEQDIGDQEQVKPEVFDLVD